MHTLLVTLLHWLIVALALLCGCTVIPRRSLVWCCFAVLPLDQQVLVLCSRECGGDGPPVEASQEPFFSLSSSHTVTRLCPAEPHWWCQRHFIVLPLMEQRHKGNITALHAFYDSPCDNNKDVFYISSAKQFMGHSSSWIKSSKGFSVQARQHLNAAASRRLFHPFGRFYTPREPVLMQCAATPHTSLYFLHFSHVEMFGFAALLRCHTCS